MNAESGKQGALLVVHCRLYQSARTARYKAEPLQGPATPVMQSSLHQIQLVRTKLYTWSAEGADAGTALCAMLPDKPLLPNELPPYEGSCMGLSAACQAVAAVTAVAKSVAA